MVELIMKCDETHDLDKRSFMYNRHRFLNALFLEINTRNSYSRVNRYLYKIVKQLSVFDFIQQICIFLDSLNFVL